MNAGQVSMPFIEFYREAKMDKPASEALGRRVTKDVNMVRIVPKGGSLVLEKTPEEWIQQLKNKSINQAHDAYPLDWINQIELGYESWKKGFDAPLNGTSVKEWAYLSPAQSENLIGLRILTIEDVSEMTEEALGNYGMGARELRDKAKEYLKGKSVSDEVAKENQELKKQMAEMQAQLAELMAQPKRGRPAKE
jgi:hypothetical protein